MRSRLRVLPSASLRNRAVSGSYRCRWRWSRLDHRPSDALIGDAGGIIVADAESEQNLEYLAEGARLSGTRLLCGSAGPCRSAHANACAAPHAELPLDPARDPPVARQARPGHCGGCHPQTVQQVMAAEAAGIPVIRPGLTWFEGLAFPPPDRTPRDMWPEEQKLATRCMQQLASGPLIITSEGCRTSRARARRSRADWPNSPARYCSTPPPPASF